MKVFRQHLLALAVILSVLALLFTFISFLSTQRATTTYWNVNRESMRSGEMSWSDLDYVQGADLVDITVSFDTDGEFDVWLVDDAKWDGPGYPYDVGTWLRHGIAGAGDLEWTVSAPEFEGNLVLVEENMAFGDRGSLFNGTTVNYDWRITTRSMIDPMVSPFTWMAIILIVAAAAMLAWSRFLPAEEVRDFNELYPGSSV